MKVLRGSDADRILVGERCEVLMPWPDQSMVACQSWPEAVWYVDGQRVVTCHAHDAEMRADSASEGARG